MNNKILLINDLAGYGKVALSAMIQVLSHMKYEIFSLPTAIDSDCKCVFGYDDKTREYFKAVSHGDACGIYICGYIKIWRKYSESGERKGGICLPGC